MRESTISSSTGIERPTFHEGQILGSDDLSRSLGYARDQDARHERFLHTWGIASGLTVEKQNNDFVLQKGFAIDSSGAPVLVLKPIILNVEQLYDEAFPSEQDDGKLFPLFVVRTQEPQAGDGPLKRCADGGESRMIESATVLFRPFATDWDSQAAVDVSDGPVDQEVSDRVVLVGFVEWKLDDASTKGRIEEFHLRDDSSGIGPRYAGVRADEVVARAGKLVVRSKVSGTQDAPIVVLGDHDQGKDEKAFVLGLDNGLGSVNELLTVDPKGNVRLKGSLKADGTLTGQIRSGEVAIESGIASDGLILPLPVGIKPEQVEDGSVALHITVAPRINWAQQPADGWGPFTLDCSVDSSRRVRCTTRWMNFAVPGESLDFTDAVDYVISATVAAAGEDT